MKRGFEQVSQEHKQNFSILKDEKQRIIKLPIDAKLPKRADKGSAGYDFHLVKDIRVLPGQTEIIWTDIKAYMQQDELLNIYIRSSIAIEHGIEIATKVSVIDSSYYNNIRNEGNISIPIINRTGKTFELRAGERIAQGIFTKYLLADQDEVIQEERVGGSGSSGK